MNNASQKFTKGNILVVDDTPNNLQALTEILLKQGYTARPAPNGRLALRAARVTPPDVVLLDIIMPHMDGYEVCTQLKADERTQDIPVIFISALGDVVDKVRGFSVGGVDYVTKPFDAEDVLARVETHVSLHKMQQQLEEQNEQLQQLHQEAQEAKTAALEAQRAAEAANRTKSTFLRNVSHELRTPLTAILGFAQLMAHSQTLLSEDREHLERIRWNGEQLLKLVNRLIDLTRMEAEQGITMLQDFDLQQLLGDAVVNPSSSKTAEDGLSPEQFTMLPSELLTELMKATEMAELDLIQASIGNIRDHDSALADVLIQLADNFEYDRILSLLEKATSLQGLDQDNHDL